MDGFRLTAEEIRSLWALHRRGKDRQWADCIKAVVLWGTGWTVPDTAEALLRDEDIYTHRGSVNSTVPLRSGVKDLGCE